MKDDIFIVRWGRTVVKELHHGNFIPLLITIGIIWGSYEYVYKPLHTWLEALTETDAVLAVQNAELRQRIEELSSRLDTKNEEYGKEIPVEFGINYEGYKRMRNGSR